MTKVEEDNDHMNHIQSEPKEKIDYLESSVINDILKNIENLENNYMNKGSDEQIDIRIKQLAYSKLLVNVYEKDNIYLINAHTNLGITYLGNKYLEQALEHLLTAFKLNENLGDSEENDQKMKELQIKILINLSKSYLELKKVAPALNISERCLKMNQTLYGDEHVSNAEIYNILANGNALMENFKAAEGFFSKMFDIYEKTFGFDSDKCAETCVDLAKIYEMNNNLVDSAEYYKFAYEIWDKVIKVTPSEDGFDKIYLSAIKHSELLFKNKENKEAFGFLKQFESKICLQEFKCSDKEHKCISIVELLIKIAESMKNLELQYEELKHYEVSFYMYYFIILAIKH